MTLQRKQVGKLTQNYWWGSFTESDTLYDCLQRQSPPVTLHRVHLQGSVLLLQPVYWYLEFTCCWLHPSGPHPFYWSLHCQPQEKHSYVGSLPKAFMYLYFVQIHLGTFIIALTSTHLETPERVEQHLLWSVLGQYCSWKSRKHTVKLV